MTLPPKPALFDEAYYRWNNDGAFDGDPWEHFATTGWKDRRDPHRLFDVAFYLAQVPELEAGDLDPLTHFLDLKADAIASPHPLFDTAFYNWRYHAFLRGLNPLEHYMRLGVASGYDPHPFFSTDHYRRFSPDVRALEENLLEHFVRVGALERNRHPHPDFNQAAFVKAAGLPAHLNPLVEFSRRLFAMRVTKLERYERPEYSIVVLNLNKPHLTLQCVVNLVEATAGQRAEIVVVDNGSEPREFEFLARSLPDGVHLVRLSTNRFFGEGNNIGIEASSGRYVLILNNDAFIDAATLPTLRDALERYPDAGAAGPLFIYPDGRIQEAGAFMSSDGTALQRGKFRSELPPHLAKTESVDYISAACLLVRRTDLDAIAGFDLTFDPAYYEDTDLCLRLRERGKKTYYCPDAIVVHVENATSSNPKLGLSKIVETNRSKFVARWGNHLRGTGGLERAIDDPPELRQPRNSDRLALLCTPYPLMPGGGERYLLDIASILSERFRTIVITPERYSEYRLRTLSRDLNIDLAEVRLDRTSALATYANCDAFFAIGNELFPTMMPLGKQRFYICQFPFPMVPWHVANAFRHLEAYDSVIVYSPFVAEHYAEKAAVYGKSAPVAILPPACPQIATTNERKVPGRILSVGRFIREGHDKRQDALIDAFRTLCADRPDVPWELHLVGTLPTLLSAREHLEALRKSAKGLPVTFHVNAPAPVVESFYATSEYYWHATGFERSVHYHPETHEHFGISVIEAMSAGAIPLVHDTGGPSANVRDEIDGFHWHTLDDLVRAQMWVASLDRVARERMSSSARARAAEFDRDVFRKRLLELVEPAYVTV